MRKLMICLFACLLCATFAVAQASSPSQPAAQQPSSSQSTPSSDAATPQSSQPADQSASQADRDRAKSDSDAAAASRSQADQNAAKTDADRQAADQNAAAANQNAQRAASPAGGVPWGWIVLGIVVVAIILALIGRGSDRPERVESIDRSTVIDRDRDLRDRDVVVRDRRDDDIRRVG